jgi:CHAT domain-containing protein/tetratricopeptide (TPR) repeat protein
MREEADRLVAASQTGRWARARRAVILVAVLAASCSRTGSPDAAYAQSRRAFLSGDLDTAIALASAGAARFKSDRNSPWFWKFRLLQAEALSAEYRNKEAAELLADPVPATVGSSQLEAQRLVDQANLPVAGVANLLQQARAAATDPELQIRISLREGSLHLNEADAGEPFFRTALEVANREGNSYWEAMALNNLSISKKRLRRFEDSIDLGLQALDVARKAGAHRAEAFADGNLGSIYALLGDFEPAFEHQDRAERVLERIGARNNQAIALGELGLLYDLQGNTAKAAAYYERAYKLAGELNMNGEAERDASNLSIALIRAGEWDKASQWNDRASALAPPGNVTVASILARNRAQIAYGRGTKDESARICKELLSAKATPPDLQWELHALLGRIDRDAGRFAEANREFEVARKIIDQTRSDLGDSHYRITLLSRMMGFYQDYVDLLFTQKDDEGALRIVELSRARVLAEQMGRTAKPAEVPDLAALRNLARSTNSRLLTFWVAPGRSFAWLIEANGVRSFELPPAAEIEALVDRYRPVVEHSITDPIASHDRAAAALWSKLLGAIAPLIPKDSRLIVIPDGPLHRVNLETMVAPAPQPHYWIEDVELAIAPSLTIAASRSVGDPWRTPSVLLIGAPNYVGSDYTPLPNAAAELQSIEGHFAGAQHRVLKGPQASPAAYAQAGPGGFSLIHFAAHAEANAISPLESAIILSRQDGQDKLYAREVLNIPIHADLVTISSCRSAGARAYAGEGLIGFAWAFLLAGARNVVAGLWDVSDSSTELLMDRFYAGIHNGQDPAKALHNAKMELLKGEARYRKPFYWAPFQVYVGSTVR